MKNIAYILFVLVILGVYSCEEKKDVPPFEDVERLSIYDYLMEKQDTFSSFIQILEKGGIAKTLSAYNPEGTGYTLFLPDNNAVERYINMDDQVSSLSDIVNDPELASDFARYHVVQIGVHTNNFPFGAFPEPTLSNDRLTVSFIIEQDTSYYKINNQAAVVKPNIELSNGFVHLIETALQPVSFTTYEWLERNEEYSIFKEAVDLTGLQEEFSINTREEELAQPITLLLESNEVYNDFGIQSVEDLAAAISPDNDNYTAATNPLYNFVSYHALTGNIFIDDFEGENTNYSTLSDVPLRINGRGLEFTINEGKDTFDIVVVEEDTTYIDYIGFYYDESNVITQSGAIHMIDKLLEQQIPSRATQTFQFFGEPAFDEFRQEPGTYELDNDMGIRILEWKSAADLYFVELGDQETSAWNADYLQIDGDFEITYTIPKIVQGRYEFFIGAELFSSDNASVEVLIDGKKIGGLVDLTDGGSANNPFQRTLIGTVDFKSYRSHEITVRTLIPGQFLWDYVRFEPI